MYLTCGINKVNSVYHNCGSKSLNNAEKDIIAVICYLRAFLLKAKTFIVNVLPRYKLGRSEIGKVREKQ